MRPSILLLALAGLPAPASLAVAQGLPFRVTIVDWAPAALARQQQAFRSGPKDREVLFCVEAWRRVEQADAFERIVIERVRMERDGARRRIVDVASNCVGPNGEALPMFHTHADGNCQFSPADLITLVGRGAPFEGVQCGAHHFIWSFAWQVVAIANTVERERLASGERRDPR